MAYDRSDLLRLLRSSVELVARVATPADAEVPANRLIGLGLMTQAVQLSRAIRRCLTPPDELPEAALALWRPHREAVLRGHVVLNELEDAQIVQLAAAYRHWIEQAQGGQSTPLPQIELRDIRWRLRIHRCPAKWQPLRDPLACSHAQRLSDTTRQVLHDAVHVGLWPARQSLHARDVIGEAMYSERTLAICLHDVILGNALVAANWPVLDPSVKVDIRPLLAAAERVLSLAPPDP